MRRWLLLMAHQDDEMTALPLVRGAAREDVEACVYFTDGGGRGGKPAHERRNAETLRVLARLGIGSAKVDFLGVRAGIPDGALHAHLNTALDAFTSSFKTARVTDIATLAWEGGHPDHDATHLLGLAIGQHLNARVWSFPLYNAYRTGILPFRVMSECSSERTSVDWRITGSDRVEALRSPASYPSQFKSMLGLYLPLLWQYCTRRNFKCRSARPEAVATRPHEGRLLYERRGWMTYDEFDGAVAEFKLRAGLPGPTRASPPIGLGVN